MNANRRTAFKAAFATGAALALAGCGFQLRRAPEFDFQRILVRTAQPSTLTRELVRELRATHKVQVVTDRLTPVTANQDPPRDGGDAAVVLDILDDRREKMVSGMSAVGQVVEFELRVRLRYRLRNVSGAELIPETELLLRRDLSYNEQYALAKQEEELQMMQDMQSDVVQQLLRQLATVKQPSVQNPTPAPASTDTSVPR